MIDSKYISQFLPLHELDELKADHPKVVDLSANDLFLISKVSAYTDRGEPAVTVSKKLSYKNLLNKISADEDIYKMKTDISFLSSDLIELSDEVQEKYDDLSTRIHDASVWLSSQTFLSVTSLSNCVEKNYIKKYGTSASAIISAVPIEGAVDRNKYYIATSLQLSDGQIDKVYYDDIQNFITIDGTKVAGGTVLGDVQNSQTITLTDSSTTQITYKVKDDCYLVIEANIYEEDATNKPVEVWLRNLDSDQHEMTAKLAQFNNPGGYTGRGYYNYYFSGFPIKQIQNGNDSETEIRIKYKDGSRFKYDANNKTTVKFIEYAFYATVAKADLEKFVPSTPVEAPFSGNVTPKSLYEFSINKYGLVVSATPVSIDAATTENLGLIKLGVDSGDNYGLKVNSSGQAYITVPKASTSKVGTIKLGTGNSGTNSALTVDLKADSSGKGYVEIPVATDSKLGLLKTSTLNTTSGANLQLGVRASNGAGYVNIPFASSTQSGVMKAGVDSGAGTQTNVYIGSDGIAKVRYSSAPSFSATEKASLASTDKILVNYSSNNLANYIQYGNLATTIQQMMPVVPTIPTSSRKTLLKSVEKQSNSKYTVCTITTSVAGWYLFTVYRNGSEGDMWNSNACFCSVQVNSLTVCSANCSYWNHVEYIPAGVKLTLLAWSTNSETSLASGERRIYLLG